MTIPGLRINFDSGVPVYRQIAEGVRSAALDGSLRTGHRLPATRDLARRLGVNRNTVVAAYEMLAGEGWVRSHTGKGTFLIARPNAAVDVAEASAPEPGTWFTAFSRSAEGAAVGGLQAIYKLAIATEGISFVGSYPSAELMPVEPFSRAMAEVLRNPESNALAYGPTAGYPALKETIAADMRRKGSPTGPEDILITNGAQQAIELVFRTFVERGDAVIIEEPTYTGALTVLGSLGARVIGIPVDDEGLRPDLLAIALERYQPRLIYVQPTFQNPTARLMTEARRREVLALAHRYRCPVVEDDWGGDLRYEGRDLPSLHALDGGKHVFHLGTFSKKLMPGLRIGWVAAPRPALEHLVELKRIQDCGTSPLLQAALDLFLRNGGLDEHLNRIRPAYLERRDLMLAAMERHFHPDARWSRPAGGLFLWVTLPPNFDGEELFLAAQQHGVLFSRGELFHSDGSGRNTFRLTYSTATPQQIEAGVRILGRLMRERWPGRSDTPDQPPAETMPIF
jgi:GntR family transcriptional regulator/MocR family aminotransferase